MRIAKRADKQPTMATNITTLCDPCQRLVYFVATDYRDSAYQHPTVGALQQCCETCVICHYIYDIVIGLCHGDTPGSSAIIRPYMEFRNSSTADPGVQEMEFKCQFMHPSGGEGVVNFTVTICLSKCKPTGILYVIKSLTQKHSPRRKAANMANYLSN
jgi:hypothetical protein